MVEGIRRNSSIEQGRRSIDVTLPTPGQMLTSRSLFISGRSQLLKQSYVVDLDNIMERTSNNNDLCFCRFDCTELVTTAHRMCLDSAASPVAWIIDGIESIQSRGNSG